MTIILFPSGRNRRPDGNEFFHFAVIAVKDFLLKMLGVGAGIMFSALEAHFDPPHVKVVALLFDFPAVRGDVAEVIIETFAQLVVQ